MLQGQRMMAESGASALIGEMAIISEIMEGTTTPKHEHPSYEDDGHHEVKTTNK